MHWHSALEKLGSQIRRRIGQLICVLAIGFLGASHAAASGLRISMRIEAERSAAVIPVTRNFKPCFKPNAAGVPVMGLCAPDEEPQPERQPATKKSPRSFDRTRKTR